MVIREKKDRERRLKNQRKEDAQKRNERRPNELTIRKRKQNRTAHSHMYCNGALAVDWSYKLKLCFTGCITSRPKMN